MINKFQITIIDALETKRFENPNILLIGKTQDHINNIENFAKRLSDFELKRAGKFIKKEDYDTYIISHYFLRKSLAQKSDTDPEKVIINFESGEKPTTQSTQLDFNMSHSSNYFAIVLANEKHNNVGVDIEKTKPIKDLKDLIKGFFHNEEADYILNKDINSKSQETKFLEIWTRKEAFLKMIGIGLVNNLKNINLCFGKREIHINEKINVNTNPVFIHTYIEKEYIYSIASNKKEPSTIHKIEKDNTPLF